MEREPVCEKFASHDGVLPLFVTKVQLMGVIVPDSKPGFARRFEDVPPAVVGSGIGVGLCVGIGVGVGVRVVIISRMLAFLYQRPSVPTPSDLK